ncbi:hypothetical protein LguiB_000041 [Lonicera macranthoides]
MSSNTGASLPTSSMPSSSSSIPSTSQLCSGKVQKEKMKVIFQVDGSVVGEYAKVWNTRTGDLVRSHIPIHYPDWRIVPDNFKNDVWTALMSEFELNVPPKVARPLAEKTWSQKFRTYKSTLRVVTKNSDRMTLEPKGVDPHIWRNFVKNESDPKKQLQNAKNSENRKMLKVPHCLGRRTYAQKQYMMEQEYPGKKIRRVDKWYAAHERPDGTVLQSARSKYDEVKAAESRRKGPGITGVGYYGEKKIWVEEVMEPDARLWDPPQGEGDYNTLAGYAQGGYVIWLECWLKYV